MSRLRLLTIKIKDRFKTKKTIQALKKPLSYEEVIRRYEELSA